MKIFWVIDTKVTALEGCGLSDDGSTYIFGRTVVPASTEEEAVSALKAHFDQSRIQLEEVISVVAYDEGDWSSDRHLLSKAYRLAKATNDIRSAAFISERSRDYTERKQQGLLDEEK
ncbi:hypothetical protein EUZ85_19510 [Hahella sp. KA22]|uniref:hypothetical protein n=1 Tax=Hahella sp. KA22 TaxID=1628392 RepID=UPI000FDCEA50|nr:hypothetical protein [Hahella sp. KA22]AZZ92792.1 hypothetical protein ENC22_16930 [Hahella sp. KA22]QAY56166.1 hypothetical protein EUZ85_19510 [Hahella sp. KA22]